MRFMILCLTTLLATTIALPQRGRNRPGRFGNRPNRRPNNRPGGVADIQPAPAVPNDPQNGAPAPPVQTGAPAPPAQNGVPAAVAQDNAAAPPAQNGGFDPSLVPEFGIQAGQQPDGTGNCVGNNGVLIPCTCPPDRQDFIGRVQAAAAAGNSEGVPISFPTGNSSADRRARIGASIIVLQNLNGRGVGCPAAATTFLAQQAAA